MNKKGMKNIKIGLAALLAAGPMGVVAQEVATESTLPVLAVPTKQSVDYRERTLMFNVHTNGDFNVSSDADWVTVRKGSDDNVYVHVSQNLDRVTRKGNVTFSTTGEDPMSRTLVVSQSGDGTASTLEPVRWIKPSSASDNAHQGNNGVALTYDDDLSTIYHSPYPGFSVSRSNPVILTYNFTNVDQIDFINYIPRQSGTNGNFGEVEIYVKCDGNDGSQPYKTLDFEKSSSARSVEFDTPLINPTQIEFRVYSGGDENGGGPYASCAEMQFGVNQQVPGSNIFKDKLMTELVDDFTAANLDTLSNPFIRTLATKILSGNYDTKFRVGSYECLLDPQTLSAEWSTPGKLYDQIQGVTGIMLTQGKTAVIVDGIPEDKSVGLRVIGWSPQKDSDYNADGKYWYKSETYALRNGINIIDKTSDWPGLAYITYYSSNPDGASDVKVHFVNAQVNGYLTPHQSNDELQQILDNSCYTTIDLNGDRVHSCWEVSALKQYTTGRYVEMMNILDSLIAWEHYLIGFEKFGRVPKNKTLAFVNYDYYMYQGGMGVTFMYDTQYRVLNPNNMRYHDSDAIWGFSHEWGHQHQMNPYFCWSNLAESSNNMNSVYNMLRMGYVPNTYPEYVSGEDNANRVVSTLEANVRAFFENYVIYSNSELVTRNGSMSRSRAYKERNTVAANYGWSPKMVEMAESMKDSIVYSMREPSGAATIGDFTQNQNPVNVDRSLSMSEINLNQINNVMPFYMLHNYFTLQGDHDYQLDVYELIRTTDERGKATPDVSTLLPENTRHHDKYALLASVQNQKTDVSEFTSRYPNSVWTTEEYINERMNARSNIVPYILNYIRVASLRSGYNLYPYFEKFGFLRLIACWASDYTSSYYCLTQDMRDEFEKDMEDLGLKEVSDEMVEEIINTKIQTFARPDFSNEPTPLPED